MLCAIVQDWQVVEVADLSEEAVQLRALSAQAVVGIDGLSPAPAVGWMLAGNRLVPPVYGDQVEYVMNAVYDPVKKFAEALNRKFIAENIAWGITQMGKTRAVGDFMEPVEKWWKRFSMFEVIQELEIAKAKLQADSALAASLAPFVTVSRLDSYKLQILKYLGLA